MSTVLEPAPALRVGRAAGIDALRGVAVLLMLVDHVWIVAHHGGEMDLVRWITRAAMPLFFLLGGHLFRRLTRRHLGIGLVGLGLPVLVPWIDSPNVLFWYAAGCGLLAVMRWGEVPLWAPVVGALVMTANNLDPLEVGSYGAAELFALMCLGAMLPRATFTTWCTPPAWIQAVGRFPLSIYVGHLLVLQLLLVVGVF